MTVGTISARSTPRRVGSALAEPASCPHAAMLIAASRSHSHRQLEPRRSGTDNGSPKPLLGPPRRRAPAKTTCASSMDSTRPPAGGVRDRPAAVAILVQIVRQHRTVNRAPARSARVRVVDNGNGAAGLGVLPSQTNHVSLAWSSLSRRYGLSFDSVAVVVDRPSHLVVGFDQPAIAPRSRIEDIRARDRAIGLATRGYRSAVVRVPAVTGRDHVIIQAITEGKAACARARRTPLDTYTTAPSRRPATARPGTTRLIRVLAFEVENGRPGA